MNTFSHQQDRLEHNVEHSDSEESTNLAPSIAAMADRAAVVKQSLCYHVSAAEFWTYE